MQNRSLLVCQRVEDFDKWYAVFSSHAEDQHRVGLKDLQPLRDVSDPNVFVCFFKVEDLDKARAFTSSPDAGDAKTESGIIGTPDVLWLDEI